MYITVRLFWSKKVDTLFHEAEEGAAKFFDDSPPSQKECTANPEKVRLAGVGGGGGGGRCRDSNTLFPTRNSGTFYTMG